VTLAYESRIGKANLKLDREQLKLARAFDELHESLSSHRQVLSDDRLGLAALAYSRSTHWTSRLMVDPAASCLQMLSSPPRGLYVHGDVGVGKSMLADLFYSVCDDGYQHKTEVGAAGGQQDGDDSPSALVFEPIRLSRMRRHFHEFMLETHQRIHRYKQEHPRSDPIPHVAAEIAKGARLLCLDEMQVLDIADAMILRRLMTLLMDLGVVVVTTSNRPPDRLYEGGINRSVFLPFIDTIQKKMDVIEILSDKDYRRLVGKSESCGPPAYVLIDETENAQSRLKEWFASAGGEPRPETVPVAMGRSIHAVRSNDLGAWFDFDELCDRPLGAADYIALADRFGLIIVEGVPQLGADTYNQATLVDAAYEARAALVLSSRMPMSQLFVGFDAEAEPTDGDEEVMPGEGGGSNEETVVVGEGGSSSSHATTMVKAGGVEVEWSATGRVGVSLAQLSSVREVAFSFRRAQSRLVEMSTWEVRR